MRIKAKIAYNHHAGTLPRGAVIEEDKAAAEDLVARGKFDKAETGDVVSHKIVDGAWKAVPPPAAEGAKAPAA